MAVTGQTRFFCRCGRLLTVDASTAEVICPTCRERNAVPRLGASAAPPEPKRPHAPAPVRDSAPPATTVLRSPGHGPVGRFELLAVLGHGGTGTVHRARDRESGREVALKLLHPALQGRSDFVSRFQREARAAAALSHENIVRILDAGIEDGVPWLAMELVEGEDLLAAAQQGAVHAGNVLAVMQQAARGLEAAARVGITHRDVKPGNLVLRRDGVLKVADFGLAKAVDSSTRLTVTGEVLGTPHYMSPEQGRGERVDHRADLYALGATFYHVLAGVPPFDAETPVAVILKHMREEPLPLRERCPRASPGLERVIHRLLQKDPEQRYQSYSALLSDLERLADGVEPAAGADPPLRRIQAGASTYVLPPETPTELLLKPAGGIRRLAALVVDVVAVQLALAAFLVAGRVFVRTQGSDAGVGIGRVSLTRMLAPGFEGMEPWQASVLAIGCAGAALLYFALSDAHGGRTLGKKWFRLRLCRRDGRDLGVLRAGVRTLLVFPGVALIVPTLAKAVRALAGIADPAPGATSQVLAVAGFAWLLVLELIGNMSALGRPLQDGIVGAFAFKAELAARLRPRALQPAATLVSPQRALRLSIVPGLGLLYAGHALLGILAFGATIFCLANLETPSVGLAIWIAAAFSAHAFAVRRRARALEARESTAKATATNAAIRRQEN